MDLVQPFVEARERRIHELVKLRQDGRKVIGFFCLHTPPALIEAAGGIPLRLCLQGDSVMQRSGELLSRNCLCPFIKACIGHLETGNRWFINVDALAISSMCDQMRHLADVWRSRFHLPCYVFFRPRGLEKKEAIWIYQQELRWLFYELSAFCNTGVNQAETYGIIERYNSIRYYLLAVHHMRATQNPAITGAEWLAVVQAGFVLDSRNYLELLRRLYKQLTCKNVPPRGIVRIMLAGGMLAQGDDRIVQAIEDTGRAMVITDALCAGTRAIGGKIIAEGDLLSNIIKAYLSQVPCIHARPNQALYEYIDRQVKQFGVDGVVFQTLKFCDGWGSEWCRMQQFLKQRGIPSIVIDTDYGTADTGQIATRVGAFLEMLEDKKSLTAKPPSRQG